jgi:hypothetical protein
VFTANLNDGGGQSVQMDAERWYRSARLRNAIARWVKSKTMRVGRRTFVTIRVTAPIRAPLTFGQRVSEWAQQRMQQLQEMAMIEQFAREAAQNILEITLSALVRPETAEGMATFTKNYHDALVSKGFSKEDALRIVMAHGVPRLLAGR